MLHITLLCVQRKTADDGQRNCPKHVEFYSKNKFEKLVHLVDFIVRTTKLVVDFHSFVNAPSKGRRNDVLKDKWTKNLEFQIGN